jgi:hypothetical protein
MDRRLRVTIIVPFLLLFVAVLAASSFSGQKQEHVGKFYVHKTKVELGEYYEGEDIGYTFKVRNNGVGELHIVNVRPG